MTTPTTSTVFDGLCDDVVAHILSYLDFPSAVRFTTHTTKSLSKRILSSSRSDDDGSLTSSTNHHHFYVWHDMYKRHCLTPLQDDDPNFMLACRDRRRLFQNLMTGAGLGRQHPKKQYSQQQQQQQQQQRKRKTTKSSCFHLPNRYFHFLPISPLDDDDDDDWGDDSPPVDFACRSFVLTSTGVGSELLFLDPFDGTVTIHSNVTQNAQKSDEAMMEHAMIQAADNIVDSYYAGGPTTRSTTTATAAQQSPQQQQQEYVRQRKGTIVSMDTAVTTASDDDDDDNDTPNTEQQQQTRINDNIITAKMTTTSDHGEEHAHIAGTIIDESIYRNFNSQNYKTEPRQILFDVQDYFDLNLSDYFWGHGTGNHNNNATNGLIPRGRDPPPYEQPHRFAPQHHPGANHNRAPIHILAGGNTREEEHPPPNNNNIRDDMIDGGGDEIVIDYIGIDSKPILNDTFDRVEGTMVGVGRTLSNHEDGVLFDHGGDPMNEDGVACTEMLLWRKRYGHPRQDNHRSASTTVKSTHAKNTCHQQDLYTEKFVCRLGWLGCCIEMCAKYNKLYAVFYRGDGPTPPPSTTTTRNPNHHDDNDDETAGDTEELVYGGRHIFVYPILPLTTTKNKNSNASSSSTPQDYFPNPEFHIECQHSISSVVVDVSGRTLLVGTVKGTIEVFDVHHTGIQSSSSMAIRRCVLDIKSAVMESTKRLRLLQQQQQLSVGTKVDRKIAEITTPVRDVRCEGNVAMILQEESMSSSTDTEATAMQVEEGDLEGSNPTMSEIINNNMAPVLVEESAGDDAVVVQQHQQAEEGAGNNNNNHDQNDIFSNTTTATLSGMPRLNKSRTIESIHFPLHLPVEQCGFVSLQHHRTEGTTLLLWAAATEETLNQQQKQYGNQKSPVSFQVVSVINLPLSARRKPRVFYDGRRLIVFGQDHIGMIILVYHVLNTWEDIDSFVEEDEKIQQKSSTVIPAPRRHHQGDDSAGVNNLTNDPIRCKFANRIRHAGLGGLEYYDSIYMTCNERFIVVNTKTGNLVGGGGCSDEGLLIIDLQEHS